MPPKTPTYTPSGYPAPPLPTRGDTYAVAVGMAASERAQWLWNMASLDIERRLSATDVSAEQARLEAIDELIADQQKRADAAVKAMNTDDLFETAVKETSRGMNAQAVAGGRDGMTEGQQDAVSRIIVERMANLVAAGQSSQVAIRNLVGLPEVRSALASGTPEKTARDIAFAVKQAPGNFNRDALAKALAATANMDLPTYNKASGVNLDPRLLKGSDAWSTVVGKVPTQTKEKGSGKAKAPADAVDWTQVVGQYTIGGGGSPNVGDEAQRRRWAAAMAGDGRLEVGEQVEYGTQVQPPSPAAVADAKRLAAVQEAAAQAYRNAVQESGSGQSPAALEAAAAFASAKQAADDAASLATPTMEAVSETITAADLDEYEQLRASNPRAAAYWDRQEALGAQAALRSEQDELDQVIQKRLAQRRSIEEAGVRGQQTAARDIDSTLRGMSDSERLARQQAAKAAEVMKDPKWSEKDSPAAVSAKKLWDLTTAKTMRPQDAWVRATELASAGGSLDEALRDDIMARYSAHALTHLQSRRKPAPPAPPSAPQRMEAAAIVTAAPPPKVVRTQDFRTGDPSSADPPAPFASTGKRLEGELSIMSPEELRKARRERARTMLDRLGNIPVTSYDGI